MLKGDFHMHTNFSPDCIVSPESLVARCLEVGLNCIAVTDHNSIQGSIEVKRIAPFMVIQASEIKTTGGEITGLFIQEEIPAGLAPVETAKRIKEQGGLVSLPHPFDHLRRSVIGKMALEEVLPYADIIEVFNARNVFDSDNRKAMVVAKEHGLVPSAVSDAHSIGELGDTYVEFPEFDGTPAGFKEALRQGRLVTRKSNPLIHLITGYAKLKKRWFGG